MCVPHWYSAPGCGHSILGSNSGPLPILYTKENPRTKNEFTLLDPGNKKC